MTHKTVTDNCPAYPPATCHPRRTRSTTHHFSSVKSPEFVCVPACSNPALLLTDRREEELQENDSELTYLRLGLKAIEVQLPLDVDPDLNQSILNWKADWTALKRKRAKNKSYDRSAYSTPLGTPIRPPR